ncbi:MAG: ATP-binding protein [Thermoproteota archaeon]|nr:ATP-binding protein [Thermoproteota archaeon]
MKPLEEKSYKKYFTDFDGRFHARMSAVIPKIAKTQESKFAGISARYDCRIKVEYQKDLMGLLEEGMLIAVKNFKPAEDGERCTLMEASRVWPEHFGLRGLSNHSYYPMQFEIIKQSEADWETDDQATMMIQISAIPVNYDLIIHKDGEPEFKKGFSYPVVAGEAHILNSQMINRMYNQNIVEEFKVDIAGGVPDAKISRRLGVVKMFETRPTRIPIYVDFESLVRYHFGVFAFTGGGKSNLMSNILRRILYHTSDTKVVIFDISCEYPFLLMDILTNPEIPAKVTLERRVDTAEQFYNSVVKPREYEDDERVQKGLEKIIDQGKVSYYTKPRFRVPTYGQFLNELKEQRKANTDKPHYTNAVDETREYVLEYMNQHTLIENQEVNEDFVRFISQKATEAVQKFRVHEKSGLYGWATTRTNILDVLKKKKEEESMETMGLTVENIRELLEGEERLVCLSIADRFTIKDLVIRLTQDVLDRRKRKFQVKPYILFVFDEAQEFIPDLSGSTGIDKKCSKQVETLLRQGRKYGLGGCVATQRIAYLNTNALQQLHTYFVGTLPRPYDRSVVSSTFMIDQGILEKTLEFAPGEWLLSSYVATGIENVPIFIRADNAEDELNRLLSNYMSPT